MRPFDVSPALDSVTEQYPSADTLLAAASNHDPSVRYALCRLWLSEGIPFAFKTRPGTYEAIRSWLARQLEIQAKEITIIGSGRQGFSLSPDSSIRRQFGVHSDLDFTIVSPDLFQRIQSSLELWMKDFDAGLVLPRNDREKSFWNDNRVSCPSGLNRGFIDPHKIPSFNRYPEAQKVANAMYLIHEKLKITPGSPNVRKASLRIYRDWNAFIRQMAINLQAAVLHARRT